MSKKNDLMASESAVRYRVMEKALRRAYDVKQPCMLWGAPGVGKTAAPKKLAKELGIGFIDVRLNQMDPTDFRGVPYVKDGRTLYAQPHWLPTDPNWKGIIFLDEIVQAPQMMQNAATELILDRTLGEYKLPDGAYVMAAGNQRIYRAGTNEMPTHLKNRLLHIELEHNVDDFIDYAQKNDLFLAIVAFLRYQPDKLLDFDARTLTFPSPRAWEFVSRAYKYGKMEADVELPVVTGLIGAGNAHSFIGFMRIWDQMPDLDDLLEKPATTRLPNAETPAASYAIVTALAHRAEKTTMKAIVTYLERMQAEYQSVCMRDIFKRDPKLADLKVCEEWLRKNVEFIIDRPV